MTPPPTTQPEDLRWLEAQKLTGHCGEGNVELKARHHHNERIDRLIAGLTTILPEGAREQIARIIDPWGWRIHDGLAGHPAWKCDYDAKTQIRDGLAKADAILAILSRPGGVDNAQAFSLRLASGGEPALELRKGLAKLAALHGLGTVNGISSREPPNRSWTQEEWERRILECIPGKAEAQCYGLADAIMAMLHAAEQGPLSEASRAAGGREPPNAGSADDLVERLTHYGKEWNAKGVMVTGVLLLEAAQALTKLQGERDERETAILNGCNALVEMVTAERDEARTFVLSARRDEDTALRQLDEAREENNRLHEHMAATLHLGDGLVVHGTVEAISRASSILSSERSPASLGGMGSGDIVNPDAGSAP